MARGRGTARTSSLRRRVHPPLPLFTYPQHSLVVWGVGRGLVTSSLSLSPSPEPSPEPQRHKQRAGTFGTAGMVVGNGGTSKVAPPPRFSLFLFFIPRGLELSDTKVYEP